MEVYDKQEDGYIEVWLTRQEQQCCNRDELKDILLSKAKKKNCKVVFFLSGTGDLYQNTENLLLMNLGCA